MRAHFRHLSSKSFSMIKGIPQYIGLKPLQLLSKDSRVHQDSDSQSESSLGSVRVHSLTLFCILGSMRCDSQASFLARTLVSPCLGHGPKVRVVIANI
jgi:hypothetical protein